METPNPIANQNQDAEHLKLLSIFHYVVSACTFLFGCFPLIHVTLGLTMIFSPGSFGGKSEQSPPPFIGWFFVGIGSFIILMFWTIAVCQILAGRNLGARRRHTFCMVVGAIECLFMPCGTVLGVFTLIVLTKASVKSLFS